MKQYLFLATAIATASLFTGCSNNEYVGDQPEALNGTDGAIVFSMGKANTTRVEGSSADEKLNSVFYVYGEKTVNRDGSGDVTETVFKTYKVKYTPSTVNASASNTKGWEYVGITWDDNENNNVQGGVGNNQTIKYWDYSASQYTFYAFSANPIDVKTAAPQIKVEPFNPTLVQYIVKIQPDAHIEDLYFADRKVVAKTDNGYAGPNAAPVDKAVKLTFCNLASKVRFGFYETVPGYSIKINKMYTDDGAEYTSGFAAICPNIQVKGQPSQITVKYDSKGHAYADAIYDYDGNAPLTRSDNFKYIYDIFFDTTLSNTSSSPTWYNSTGDYTFFWPQPTNNQPLKIKVDYTLTSTDPSGEPIEVKGATAQIPVEYVKWKANTAYTYIFKISDNTNGQTGSGETPAGLYPITFDAVVEDYTNEGSITTVSTPSVTASQNGVTFVSTDNGIKFDLNEDIFLKVMMGGNEVNTVAIQSAYVTSYDYGKSPDQNRGSNPWVDVDYNTTNNYYKLDNKTEKGWWILEVKDSDTSTTATTYVIIRVGDAE